MKTFIIIFVLAVFGIGSFDFKDDNSYRIEVDLPNLDTKTQYLDLQVYNSLFDKVAEQHFNSKSVTFRYYPKAGDFLNTAIFIRDKEGSWQPQIVKMRIFYKGQMIYKYWSHAGYNSSDHFEVTD